MPVFNSDDIFGFSLGTFTHIFSYELKQLTVEAHYRNLKKTGN